MRNRSATLARKAAVAVWFATFAASAQTPRVLTLEEALRIARERQPQIRQARFLTEAASARADQARAGLLPQVSATAGYQKTTANFIARPGSVPPRRQAAGRG
jgi:outer membrane protein